MQINNIYKWMMAAVMAATLGACSNDDMTGSDNDGLATMNPDTPVGISASMCGYGQSSDISRTVPGATDLAMIPAQDELTNATSIKYQKGSFVLYGTDKSFYLSGGTLGNISSTKIGTYIPYFMPENGDGILRLRHFNLNAKDAAGNNQRNSRIVKFDYGSAPNGVSGLAALAADNDGAPALAFGMKHMGVKISVLVCDEQGDAIDVASSTATGIPAVKFTSAQVIGIGSLDNQYIYCGDKSLENYIKDSGDPKLSDIKLGFCKADGTVSVALSHPTVGTGIPANLLNGIINSSATHSKDASGNITVIATSPQVYTDDAMLQLKLTIDGVDATFNLKLSDIVVIGAPDSRTKLTYTNPNEHVVLTLKVDARRDAVDCTATITGWVEASTTVDFVEDESKKQ